MDYKEWIQQRAEELAVELFGKDYDNISEEQQTEVYNKAEAEYRDREAARIDAAYDAWLEKQLMKEEEE